MSQDYYKKVTITTVVEPWDLCEELSFNLGNALKYAFRYGKKPDNPAEEDLTKCINYLNRAISRNESVPFVLCGYANTSNVIADAILSNQLDTAKSLIYNIMESNRTDKKSYQIDDWKVTIEDNKFKAKNKNTTLYSYISEEEKEECKDPDYLREVIHKLLTDVESIDVQF